MLQRIDSGTAHLAPVSLSPHVGAPELAAGSVMHLPHGDVAADFRATGTTERHRRASYELLVANETPAPLATFAYAVEAPGERKITWNAIVVPPFSAVAVEIDIAIPRRRRMPRVVAELFSDAAQLTLDAPPQRDDRGRARRFVLLAAAGLLLALGAGAVAQTRPHVLALAAPDAVRAGAPFSVAYALAGATGGTYVVETPDGMQIRRGTLAAGSGSFTVTLPQAPRSSGYDVRVWAGGRDGSDARTSHVLALPERAVARVPARVAARVPEVRLGALTLEHDVVHGGEAIVVAYGASQDPGVVRLIDALGTVRAEALLNRRGRSIIVAPQVETDQDFRVVATAERGRGHDEVTAPVTILHAPAKPAAAPAGPAAAAAALVRTPRGVAPIAVDREQIAGRAIVVRVDRYEKHLHIALMGATSEEISGVDVTPGESSVVLTAPDVLAPTRYEIVATYASGFGQETLIRPISFRAR
ncbi:MAG: hypothetical protein NVSMB19_20470 [Vulcanimicrobiaceae bacterium]